MFGRFLAIIIPPVVKKNTESNLFLAAAAGDTLQSMVEHASFSRCLKFLLSLANEDKKTSVKGSATLYAAYVRFVFWLLFFFLTFARTLELSRQQAHRGEGYSKSA